MDLGLMIGAAVALAAVIALVAYRQPVLAFAQRSTDYVQAVRAELRKVSWPTWDDLRKSTVVILIIIAIVGAIIGLMDFLFSKLFIDLFGRVFGA